MAISMSGVLLLLCGAEAVALRATSLFSDGVVLQTSDEGGAGGRVTGIAAPAAEVQLRGLPTGTATAIAGADGAFAVEFNATSGGPCAPLAHPVRITPHTQTHSRRELHLSATPTWGRCCALRWFG